MKAIQTKGLTKYYGKARGILEIDLAVEEGDFFGFIGPNGAGKSTTIRTLLGLISPSRGEAKIFGRDILLQREDILAQVGYMPGEATFYSNMRVSQAILLSANLRKRDCGKAAQHLCERLQLDTTKKIRELSLGNRKKVSVVCALQHNPRLCVLDEPTSGLDPLMQREFYEILQERHAAGVTIFLSSHVLSEVQRFCKHAAVIREGSLLVTDSTKNLGHTEAKRVTLSGINTVPALQNTRDVRVSETGVCFLYSGSPQLLLAELARLPVSDITIAEPDLEEIFLHFYREGTNDTFKA